MGDWNVFFATSAGSAATLVGLLFVATQLHLGVFSDPKNRWAALAQSTLTILSVNFALSLFFVMPILDLKLRGEVVVLAVAVAVWRGARIWWPVVKITESGRRHRLAQSFWLLILPDVAYVYLLTGAVGLINYDPFAVLNVGGALLSLFLICLRNAWRLVVNVEQQSS